jgi:hypothetical protein
MLGWPQWLANVFMVGTAIGTLWQVLLGRRFKPIAKNVSCFERAECQGSITQ